MPSKHKTTSKEFEVKVKDWGKRLWSAIFKDGKYGEVHEVLFRDFNKLRDEGQAFDDIITKVTIINHIAPIYDHIASQGYNTRIHYHPLKLAVTNFCKGKPVDDWKAPPDQESPSPSPRLPPSPLPPTRIKVSQSKKRSKKPAISEDRVPSEADESDKELPKPQQVESSKPRKPTDATKSYNADSEAKSLPNTEGMDLCPTKCEKCESRKHGCHVNPKATKAAAACFECNHWRLKCSLAAGRTIAAKKGEDEEEVVMKDQAPKRRKKPTQVPAGQPGQLTSKPILIFC
jgi:hypothetical protein